MKPPLVSGILPFSDPRRLTLARKAVNNFIRQHYTPYELIVVNGTESNVLTNEDMDVEDFRAAGCQITEIRIPPGLNAAEMRNHGLALARGEWAIAVDDDDWFHPQRLLFQMAHRIDGHPCLLQCQLRIDVSEIFQDLSEGMPDTPVKPLLHLLKPEDGIASTALFPRLDSKGELWTYDETLNIGEHEELLARMKQAGETPVVCSNTHTPFVQGMQWPVLSIAIYHGGNELTREQFFPNLPTEADRSTVPIGLNGADIDQLKVVLQSYNFKIR